MSSRWIALQNSQRPTRDRFGLAALAIYLACSLIIFGRGLAVDPAGSFVGQTADPSVYMWFLVWWPYAIAHRLNLFVTGLLWAPVGFNLDLDHRHPVGRISRRADHRAVRPRRRLQFLCLLSPALAGWTAFLLCRRIAERFWPALDRRLHLWLFRFMIAEIRAHLLLVLIFPVPLAVMIVLRRLNEEIRATRSFSGWRWRSPPLSCSRSKCSRR